MEFPTIDKSYRFYGALSEDEDSSSYVKPVENAMNTLKTRKRCYNRIDEFFDKPLPKAKTSKKTSSIARAVNGGVSYISSNLDDVAKATHLIKIEVYDMEKFRNGPETETWKHADVRLKYYTVHGDGDKHFQNTQDVIYEITKQIANGDCKKYFYANNVK